MWWKRKTKATTCSLNLSNVKNKYKKVDYLQNSKREKKVNEKQTQKVTSYTYLSAEWVKRKSSSHW